MSRTLVCGSTDNPFIYIGYAAEVFMEEKWPKAIHSRKSSMPGIKRRSIITIPTNGVQITWQ